MFVTSRDFATKVAAELRKATAEPVVMLVGARRVHERDKVADDLDSAGFLRAGVAAGSACLVATSAGEVGIDLDADHAVMDLVPFERMVQRLGRVNRGGRDGHVALVDVLPLLPPGKAGAAAEERLHLTFELLAALPAAEDGAPLASPENLALLRAANGEAVRLASTPVPLHPPLTGALVEAWSMTSLAEHSGRPEPAPWLRGWVEEEPQTAVIWRIHLPVIVSTDPERPDGVVPGVVNAFFELASPHVSERLEAETSHVAAWPLERRAAKERTPIEPERVVAIVLSGALEFRASLTARELFATDGLSRDRLERTAAVVMGGFPIVEVLAAIGLTNARPARPERREKLRYRYGVPMAAEPLDPLFLRAALGGALAVPDVELRLFEMRLSWPRQENQARAIIDVIELHDQPFQDQPRAATTPTSTASPTTVRGPLRCTSAKRSSRSRDPAA